MVGFPKQLITWLLEQDQSKEYEVTRHHKKRSLDANAYCWVLCSKIADVVMATKDEIYLQMIHEYAPCILIPVMAGNEVKGYFKYYELFKTSTINDVPADYYKVFKGSSDMDAYEMGKFIDHIVEDAQALGIETMTPSEINRLKEMWR